MGDGPEQWEEWHHRMWETTGKRNFTKCMSYQNSKAEEAAREYQLHSISGLDFGLCNVWFAISGMSTPNDAVRNPEQGPDTKMVNSELFRIAANGSPLNVQKEQL